MRPRHVRLPHRERLRVSERRQAVAYDVGVRSRNARQSGCASVSHMKVAVAFAGLGLVVGCSSSGNSNSGTAVQGGAGGAIAGASSVAGSVATAGGSGGNGNTAGSAGSAGTSGASGGGGVDVELPTGSKELDGVVNLVDADAAAELDHFILDQSLIYPTLRHGLTKSLNLFLEHYAEAYDFVIFFTDHPVPMAVDAGIFEPVTRPAAPGGTSEIEIAADTYETTGRVKGVIGIPYNAGIFPPLAHEIAHYWAVDMDSRFGFGAGLDANSSFPFHWGYASVNGQLGGFDGATLRCETPADALPPACTALASGRTRYVTGLYAPFANSFRGLPYAPLELYVMGLAPASEVPASIQMLTLAQFPELSTDQKTMITEASGVTTLSFADIQARHGTPKLLPDGSRQFSAAFVLVSATPAADSVLNDISTWAAVFGNRKTIDGWHSFETDTGGRATLSTALGARRKVGEALPGPRAPLTCDPLAQNCSRPELACYVRPPSVCALTGNLPLNAPCNSEFACAPGLDCVAATATPKDFVCKPYCDPVSTASASACNTLCPGKYETFQDAQGATLGALCFP
jgi:hypothetical protein